MGIIKFFKGLKTKSELKKLKPDDNFEFEKEYFGDISILEGFKYIYSNNFTDKLYIEHKDILSLITCEIILPKTNKSLLDTIKLLNYMSNRICNKEKELLSNYIHCQVNSDYNKQQIQIFLRGSIKFYSSLLELHNNIITKYIRNNLFPDDISIETPNEFLNNLYNSINYPNKEIDILFIEDNKDCVLSPIIGLSINKDSKIIDIEKYDRYGVIINNRFILYLQLNNILEKDLTYIIENVEHSEKLNELIHKDINNSEYLDEDIDEIIE